jgi:hypothetical protein
MNTLQKLSLLSIFLLAAWTAQAQKGLQIETIFRDYGKQQGSTMIVLAKDVLGDNTKIERYQSLMLPMDTAVYAAVEKAVAQDIAKGKILSEVRNDGRIESAIYWLTPEKSGRNEYILLSVKKKKLTLIYVEGCFPPDNLKIEITLLQSLMISITNKQ